MRLPINVRLDSVPSRLIRLACQEPRGRFGVAGLMERNGVAPADRQPWKTAVAAFAAHRPAFLRRVERGVYEVTHEGRLYAAELTRRVEAAGRK